MTARRASRPSPRRPAPKTRRKPARTRIGAARGTPAPDHVVRQRMLELLAGGNAHVPFAAAIADFPVELRGHRPPGASHSPWQVLEHMRITQWDILEFSRDPGHVSPTFPDGYWPVEEAPPHDRAWDRRLAAFTADLEAMKRLVADPRRDLHARLIHPEAKAHHTLAREALVLADHNAYHLGELVLLRRLLGAWPPSK